jgi:predicted dehydrogenase
MTEPVRFGVIGTGFMGRTWSGVIERHVDDARLIAVAGGRQAAQLAGDHGVPALMPDALLARDDVDAVVVATPPRSHRQVVSAAAASGKHVLVEKPMASGVSDAQAMVEACDRAGVRLGVVSQHRFRAAPRAARRLLDEGRIGELRMIRVFGPAAGWDLDPGAGQNDEYNVTPFVDWGAHACDLLRWFTGSEPVRAFAQYASYTGGRPRSQSAMCQYTFASGVMAQIWMTYELPPPGLGSAMQLLLTGSEGVIELDSYGLVRLQTASGWETVFQQVAFDPLDPNASVRLEAYAAELRDVIAAIREGRDPWVSGREGVATTAMLDAAERSAASGQAIGMTRADAGAR